MGQNEIVDKNQSFIISLRLDRKTAMYIDGTYYYEVSVSGGRYLLRIGSRSCWDDKVFQTVIPKEEFDQAVGFAEKVGIRKWDGFDGYNPDILDGCGFSLTAQYSDGKSIKASGENDFPEGYGELAEGFERLFGKYRKKRS